MRVRVAGRSQGVRVCVLDSFVAVASQSGGRCVRLCVGGVEDDKEQRKQIIRAARDSARQLQNKTGKTMGERGRRFLSINRYW